MPKEEWLAAATAEAEAVAANVAEPDEATVEAGGSIAPPSPHGAPSPVDTATPAAPGGWEGALPGAAPRRAAHRAPRAHFNEIFDVSLDLETWELGRATNGAGNTSTGPPWPQQALPDVAAEGPARVAGPGHGNAANRNAHKRSNKARRGDRLAAAAVVADGAAAKDWFLH